MESTKAVNRAKQWQIALFPFNNAATNVYFAFYTYFTYYALMYLTGSAGTSLAGTIVSGGLALAISTFNSLFAPLMRVFDGITDPICGSIMDRTATRFGKFRPFMVIGNCLLALSLLLMMVFFRGLPDSMSVLRWVVYIVSYIVCNGCRIPRVVFRYACLRLAYLVCSHISSLGVDAAAHPGKQSLCGSTHTECQHSGRDNGKFLSCV